MASGLNSRVDSDRDHLLMGRLAADDEPAMAELIEHWQLPVLAHVCRSLGCADDEARDLAQEVFLRVWRQRRRWKPTAAFSTWLFTIVTNLCRNRRRDLDRRPALVSLEIGDRGDPKLDLQCSVEDDPHARAEASDLAGRLHRALEQLPENQRSALLLKRFQNMSYRQIAEVLKVTPSAVDSLLVRARRNLLVSLAQDNCRNGVESECETVDELH